MVTSPGYCAEVLTGEGVLMSGATLIPAGTLVIVVDTEIYLNAGDTVALSANITGTTPVFGDSTYSPNLTIERL